MSKITEDFIRFLKANYPDDFRKITSKDVTDDVINSILSRREEDYEIWCKIPEWVKSRYGDDLPDEVFNGNKSVKEFVHEERELVKKEEEQTKELVSFGVGLLAAGYAVETVNQLVKNKEERARLSRRARGGKLSKEEKEKYLATRLSDKAVLVKDWKENQPDKYFMYLVKEIARQNKGARLATTAGIKAGCEMKEANLRREFKMVCKHLNEDDFKKRLEGHFQGNCNFECVKKIDKGVYEEVKALLFENGIDVDKINAQKVMRKDYDKEGLAEELKKQYDERIKQDVKECDFVKIGKINGVVKDKVSPQLMKRICQLEQGM